MTYKTRVIVLVVQHNRCWLSLLTADELAKLNTYLCVLHLQKNSDPESSSKNGFNEKDVEILFGGKASLEEVFDRLDADGNGTVSTANG